MQTHKLVPRLILAAVVALVSACASLQTQPVIWPDGKVTTLVKWNRQLPGWLDGIFGQFHLDYVVNYDVLRDPQKFERQKQFVAVAEQACKEYTKSAHPTVIVDVLGDVLIFGGVASLYGPIVAAVNSAFKGAEDVNSAAYGTGYALGGAATGITSQGKRLITFYECGSGLFDNERPDVGIHVFRPPNY